MRKIGKGTTKTKGKNTNRFLIAGIIALIFALLSYSLMIALENIVLSKYDRVTVYTLKEDFAKGTQITDTSNFKKKTVDSAIVPEGALTSLSNIQGNYVKYDLPANTVVTNKMFQNIEDVVAGTNEIGIAMADLTGSVNGILRASDYIDIYIVPSNYNEEKNEATGTKEVESSAASQIEEEGDTSYIIGDTVVNANSASEALKQVDQSEQVSTKATESETEKLGNVKSIKPTYKRVYVSKVFNDDGALIPNDDTTTIASRFNIVMSDDDCNYLIGALQTGKVYVVLCRDETDTYTEVNYSGMLYYFLKSLEEKVAN